MEGGLLSAWRVLFRAGPCLPWASIGAPLRSVCAGLDTLMSMSLATRSKRKRTRVF